jgi:hypothetical protein
MASTLGSHRLSVVDYRTLRGEPMPTDQEIHNAMLADAAQAVSLLAECWSTDLDFSEASIAKVEDVCTQLYDFVDSEEERNVPMYARYLGAYIGEVYRKHVAGSKWIWQSDQYGETPAIRCGDLVIFPHDKVRKRLTAGSRENLTSYYDVFKAEAQKGKAR